MTERACAQRGFEPHNRTSEEVRLFHRRSIRNLSPLTELIPGENVRDQPHVRVRPPWQVDRFYKQLDLVHFDVMVEELGVSTTVRATPNQEYNKKLRPKKR